MSHLRVSFSAYEPPDARACDAPGAKMTGQVSLDARTFGAVVRPAAQVWRWPTAPIYISAPPSRRRFLPYVLASASALMVLAAGLVWAL